MNWTTRTGSVTGLLRFSSTAGLLLLASGLWSCEAPPDEPVTGPQSDFSARAAEDGLEVQHAAELDPGSTLSAIVDTRELEPQDGVYVLLLETVGTEASFSVVNEDGETIAESEPYAVVEGDEDSGHDGEMHYYATAEIDRGTTAKMEVIGELSEELIEGRLLFCDEVVVNHGDGPPGSLRYAVGAVRDGGSVCFDPIRFGEEVITATNEIILGSEIATSKALSIRGLASRKPNPTTYNSDRIFRFDGPTRLSSLSLTYGQANEGGLIRSSSDLSLSGVQLRFGTAMKGGGVYAGGSGTLTVSNSTVRDCEATQWGGGVFHDADGVYDDARIIDNVAGVRGGGISAGYSRFATALLRDGTILSGNEAPIGGGMQGWARVTLAGSAAVSGNTASINGGGLHVQELTMTGTSSVQGNAASLGGGGAFVHILEMTGHASMEGNDAEDGGGIYQGPPGIGPIQIHGDARIANNHAIGEGGGIRLAQSHIPDVRIFGNAQLVDNTAENGGGLSAYFSGHIFVYGDAYVARNTAAHSGGAFDLLSSDLSIDGSAVVADNTAVFGGGIRATDSLVEIGGQGAVIGNTASAFGGGIHSEGGWLVEVTDDASVTDNTAVAGGGIWKRGGGPPEITGNASVVGNAPDDIDGP